VNTLGYLLLVASAAIAVTSPGVAIATFVIGAVLVVSK
jgi:hypothetical protein